MDYYCEYTLLMKGYADKAGRRVQDWFLSPEDSCAEVRCNVRRHGAATVIISLLSVVNPRLPSSTCLLSEEYIPRSGPKYIGSTYRWAPTSFKTVSLSLSPGLPHPRPSCLFWHLPPSITGCLFVFTHSSRQTERELKSPKYLKCEIDSGHISYRKYQGKLGVYRLCTDNYIGRGTECAYIRCNLSKLLENREKCHSVPESKRISLK